MTLKEYLEKLNELVKENPKALEMIVIEEDEYLNASPISTEPRIGYFDQQNRQFLQEEDLEEEYSEEDVKANAICLI